MPLEDVSPRSDPRFAWAWILGVSGIGVFALVGSALLAGERLAWAQLAIGAAWSSALACGGWYWFYYGFSRRRSVEDTPKSRIASAAQGYVELSGVAFKLDGIRELFARDGVPCLWYRSVSGTALDAAADGTQEPFGIRDESGTAVVLPYHALVEAAHRYTWQAGDQTYAEDRIYAGDRLGVLGEFTSSEPSFDLEAAVANKLLQWREDPRALLARFDADHDGRIDAREDWKMRVQALQAARAEEQAAVARYQAVNLIKSPEDGRAFVISARSQRSLHQRLFAWEILGVAAFIAGTVGAAYFGFRLVSRTLA
ncbi:MAG TPA: hypothetical protein VMH26_12530 [Burkholderiales bacterium]|nr:hypothetical protein [Burkholderiales bacterium]